MGAKVTWTKDGKRVMFFVTSAEYAKAGGQGMPPDHIVITDDPDHMAESFAQRLRKDQIKVTVE